MPVNPVELWNHLAGDKSWVLFSHGTCVVLTAPEGDLAKQAAELMKEWGSVHVGTPAGDFNVLEVEGYPGWVVTSHHPGIFTYVPPEEFDEPSPQDVIVGLIGRSKRGQDAEDLDIVHIADKRRRSES